ncbi:MAG TPA: sigma-70 family RNA polymerase sigma factor [Bryobacteraceae bacterium]|jgi:RNA polymerase sigma factor (sigma-70 family)
MLAPPSCPDTDATDSQDSGWSLLVERIRKGEQSGMEELYRVFHNGIRFQICRQLGAQDLDDRVHDIFLLITQSIRNGELRQPCRLMGYVRTVVRRHVSAHIHGVVRARTRQAELDSGAVLSDNHPDPETGAIERENTELALRLLNSLPRRDREILTRFYLDDQPASQICREMRLTETQFRLIKSRAKARFGELGRARMFRRTHIMNR